MKVFVAGATGVIGTELLRMLVDAQHGVTAAMRRDADRSNLESVGVRPVVADLFDRDRLATVLAGTDAVINLATAIPPLTKMGRRRSWRLNDRLRTEGADNLVRAATDVGATRFVQPSIAFAYADGGDQWLDESAPLDPPATATRSALVAEASTERFTGEGRVGVVLRLGRLYGPGPASAELVGMLRRGRGVVIGDGSNYVPSLHVADAASAHLAALAVPAGVYNVTDDDPVRSVELTSAQAAAVGGPPPRRVPTWVARLLLGDAARLLTTSQRVSNARFREAADWIPRYPDAIGGAESLR